MAGTISDPAPEKCEILYGDSVVSKEHIIEHYRDFLSGIAGEQKRVSFAFRTGSVCFDAVNVFLLQGKSLSAGSI